MTAILGIYSVAWPEVTAGRISKSSGKTANEARLLV
jgi:hypothetical protein